MLVWRLKPVINSLVAAEQGASVSGQSIADNVLIAREITHSMEVAKGGEAMCIVKFDMERAYD